MNDARTAALRLLWQEARPVRPLAAAAVGVLTVSVVATLAGPLLVQHFVDRMTVGNGTGVLVTVALAYLAVALLGGGSRVWASYLSVQCGWRIADHLRLRLLRHAAVERQILDVESRSTGEVLEQVEGNADIVGRAIAEFGFRLISNVAVGIGTVVMLSTVLPAVGLGISVLVVGVCFVLSRLARRSVRRWETARRQQASLFGFIGDSLAARDDLLVLGESGWAARRTGDELDSLLRTEGRAYISGRVFWPVTQLCTALVFGLSFSFGLHQVQHGSMSAGTLTMIYLYVGLLQQPLEDMSSQAGQMQQMMAVLQMSARLLADGQPAGEAAADPGTLPDGPLEVAFENVTFRYGDAPVLRDVSFTVQPGRSLGIVGPTGAGKSTVVNLLCGLAAPAEGRVLIGGVDVHRIPPQEFARRVTVLSQRAHVFTASVRENVTLFDDSVAEHRVWQVLEQLGADAWVRELPDGLDTRVGTGARVLSEGEMQVLAGARALIRPYSLLFVDEGTSRFDPETERSWAALLDTVMRDRTVVMVEHHLGTLAGVDELMSMESGRVVDIVPAQPGGVR